MPTSVRVGDGFSFRCGGSVLVTLTKPLVGVLVFVYLCFGFTTFNGVAILVCTLLGLVCNIFGLLPIGKLSNKAVLCDVLYGFGGPSGSTLVVGVVGLVLTMTMVFITMALAFECGLGVSVCVIKVCLLMVKLVGI